MKADLPTVLLLLLMYAVLGGNVALYYAHPLHPLLHVLIGAAGIHLAFTVWHEAVHETAARSEAVNDAVGVLGMFPYMTPYFMQRWVHLEHHRKLNETEDPNHLYTSGSLLTLPLRYFKALGYAKKILRTDPRTQAQKVSDWVTSGIIGSVYAAALVTGHLWDVVVLWFVPVVVAKLVMDFYVNYLPHRGLPPDRYLGTRIIDVRWFEILVLNHNLHAIHHLWPTVPWHRYREVYERKLDFLRSNGVPIEHRVIGSWAEPARIGSESARPG